MTEDVADAVAVGLLSIEGIGEVLAFALAIRRLDAIADFAGHLQGGDILASHTVEGLIVLRKGLLQFGPGI